MWASIGAWLAVIIGPLAKKVLVALGIGVIVYTGFTALHDQIESAFDAAFSWMHPDVYKVVALAGFVDALGIWLGAFTSAALILSAKKLGLLD